MWKFPTSTVAVVVACVPSFLLAACDAIDPPTEAAAETILLSNCEGEGPPAGVMTAVVRHKGIDRAYNLFVPEGYQHHQATPLVLNFHSTNGSALDQQRLTGLNEIAGQRNVLVAYPEGLALDDQQVFDAGLRDFSGAPRDDVDFARAVVDDISRRACIDRTQVYSMGFSNGARMSFRLACEASDLFAAIVPVAGLLSLAPERCTPEYGVATLQFHGTTDPLAPFDAPGRFSLTSVPEARMNWAAKNACTDDPEVTFQQEDVTCETYRTCADGAEFTFCTIQGGGHCWTNAQACFGGASTDTVNASEMGLDFMLRFRRNQLPQ